MGALFGYLDYGHQLSPKILQKLVQALANASEVRGNHASGIAYNRDNHLTIYKRPKTEIETDSYVVVQLLEKQGKLDFDSLKNGLWQLYMHDPDAVEYPIHDKREQSHLSGTFSGIRAVCLCVNGCDHEGSIGKNRDVSSTSPDHRSHGRHDRENHAGWKHRLHRIQGQ